MDDLSLKDILIQMIPKEQVCSLGGRFGGVKFAKKGLEHFSGAIIGTASKERGFAVFATRGPRERRPGVSGMRMKYFFCFYVEERKKRIKHFLGVRGNGLILAP